MNNLPLGARWVPQISLVKWSFEALAINEFTGRKFDCPSHSPSCILTGEQVGAALLFAPGCLPPSNQGQGHALMSDCSLLLLVVLYQVLARLSYDGVSKWVPIAALCGLAAGFNLVAFFILATNTTKYMAVSPDGSKRPCKSPKSLV